jgi:hypothetical protein
VAAAGGACGEFVAKCGGTQCCSLFGVSAGVLRRRRQRLAWDAGKPCASAADAQSHRARSAKQTLAPNPCRALSTRSHPLTRTPTAGSRPQFCTDNENYCQSPSCVLAASPNSKLCKKAHKAYPNGRAVRKYEINATIGAYR